MPDRPRRSRLAFATGAAWRHLTPEDRLVADHLGRRGFAVAAAVWDDPEVDWRAFDAVVVRSCWDYHLRIEEFGAWLDRLDRLECRVWNPTRLLRWNSRKTYLEDLRRRGIATVPAVYLPAAADAELEELMDRLRADEVVVKPTVGASAYGTFRASRGEAGVRRRFRALLAERELMVQPLVREVLAAGEWSLVFFAGELSHAVLKAPAAGDFRVQEELGGSAAPKTPPPALVAAGRRTLERVAGATLYARADLVEIDGRGVLMELELIEPWLYFEADPESPDRFRRALLAHLS